MNNLTNGSFRLFRVAGIQVYVHWFWLAVALWEIESPVNTYHSKVWNAVEYLALFGIVLLHEFGHALACRQVGGQADRILLWPLGGVAYVQPPPRPGAVLWSIAAGPLVNVVLLPITIVPAVFAHFSSLAEMQPDFTHFLASIAIMNLVLLVFNLLPIYPLDGGQILQALLWFVIGRGRSLMVSGIIGLVAAAGLIVVALVHLQDTWLALIAAFVAWQAWRGFRMGAALQKMQPSVDGINQGMAAFLEGRHDDAAAHFTRLIDKTKDPVVLATALSNRGLTESRRGNWQRAIDDYREALKLQPKHANAHNNLAWILATCPIDQLRNGREAVDLATRACEATEWRSPSCLGTLAAACAEVGDFTQALNLQERANADPRYWQTYSQSAAQRMQLYEQRVPYRMPMQGG